MSTALPNPETPLAFLPPAVGNMLTISRYAYIFTLGAYSWEIFTTVNEDYRILTKFKITLPTVVYFISRIATIMFIITTVMFQAGPNADCQRLVEAIGGFSAITISMTSLLFFFRVRAVFHSNKWIVALFGLLWVGVLGSSILEPFAAFGAHIGPTQYCINSAVKSFASVAFVVNTCNDTLIFLSITFSIVYKVGYAREGNTRMKLLTGRGNLPAVSHALLAGGQFYYFVTIAGNLLTTILLLTPSASPVLKAVCTVPNLALENAMAGRVFRRLKLDLQDRKENTSLPTHAPYSMGRSMTGDQHQINIRKTIEQVTMADDLPIEMDKKANWRDNGSDI